MWKKQRTVWWMVKILSAKLYVKSRIQNSFSNIINFHFRTKKNGIFEEKNSFLSYFHMKLNYLKYIFFMNMNITKWINLNILNGRNEILWPSITIWSTLQYSTNKAILLCILTFEKLSEFLRSSVSTRIISEGT